jgi:DNA polymerase-3 subunit gamma/tau
MSYTVLARKYRPQTFADLVGQEHVSRTLGNAITSSRVAHAFLFTGARGVGKTTTARLLAKALNCESGPTPNPDNTCDACREIALGTDIDVLEIDGASNNSVDDVRRLQETLPFRPARDRFKVVIVDEVHMLSAGAFNAFLKTLEEPPEHVKFVFATTEIHKVPITIRSRCQRYDFRLIPQPVISARLREILALEKIEADDAAISLVAREAAGSMRDALTVLDQVLALGGDRLEGDAVARGLGVAGRKHVWATLRAVLQSDAGTILRNVQEVGEQGLDILNYTRQLLECARDLVVFKVVNDSEELLELSPEEREVASSLAGACAQQDLERLFSGLNALMEEVGLAGMPKLALEMGLVRLSDRPPIVPLGELLDRLSGLESRLGPAAGGGGGSARGPQRPAPPSGARGGPGGPRAFGAPEGDAPASASAPAASNRFASPVVGTAAPAAQPPVASSSAPAAPSVPSAPARSATPRPEASAPRTASIDHRSGAVAVAGATAVAARVDIAPPQLANPAPVLATAPAPQPIAAVAPQAVAAPAPASAREPQAAAQPSAAPEPASAEPQVEVGGMLGGDWLRIVNALKSSAPALAAVLDHGTPLEVSAKVLKIGFPDGSFFGRQAQRGRGRDGILRAGEQVLGARPDLQFARIDDTGTAGAGAAPGTLAAAAASHRKARQDGRREAALKHPRVQEAMEVFEESEQSVDVQVDME